MSYRVFVSEGRPYVFPDFAAMVIEEDDYVFVVGDDELGRIRVDDVRDVEQVSPQPPAALPWHPDGSDLRAAG